MTSPAREFVEELVTLGPEAHAALDAVLDGLSVTEFAALTYEWREFWARPPQIIPHGDWRSLGFLTGRMFGKTRGVCEWVCDEVEAGRAWRIGLCAQNEDKTAEVMVDGQSGLIAVSPPWFKAKWEDGRVIWPNGAQAFVYTPEVPGALRGPEHDLFWASEIVAWPAATRDEAFSNIRLGLRLGYGKLVWDTTPKRRHPLIRWLLARAEKNPTKHLIVRGHSRENIDNVTEGVIEELEGDLAGTQRGREELEGQYQDEDEEALWKQAWIDEHRRSMPDADQFLRRIIIIDPAIGTTEESDSTGMCEEGLLEDGQILVIDDMTAKHEPHAWPELALDRYVAGDCDLIVAETNRGGNLVVQNLRAVAEKKKLRIVVVDEKWKPHRERGVVFVREVNAKKSKAMRAAPVATLYQRGRVSHLIGAPLEALETLQTTWVPPPEGTRAGGRRSPDALDALVHGVVELAGLAKERKDPKAGFDGIDKAAKALAKMTAPEGVSRSPSAMLSSLLVSRGGGGSRI